MPLIGTAGHVDHGKSTLIQRLTGRDPDRWAEEKKRGLTIDLGFAWTTLPSGTEVSFVDVPGHERYMKNMLAGIEAVDVAMLVVAADEAWMPQTEEHLAVLDLLGVERGVVALTKADAVDQDLIELATLEVTEKLENTSLADIEVIAVSALTGAGVDDLVAEIDRLTATLEANESDRPRMWIDRSFPISGAGTVITGSLLNGRLTVDDPVVLYPDEVPARVRGIQSHESDLDEVDPGRRVALNLSGVDHKEITRGQMVGKSGQWATTSRFSAHIRSARYVDEVGTKGAYSIHIGSSAQPATLTGRSDKSAVIQIANPLSLTAGDRFILRDTGRKLVVGGGQVVDVSPGTNRTAIEFADSHDFEGIADALLQLRKVERLSTLAQHSAGGSPNNAQIVGDVAVDSDFAADLLKRAIGFVTAAHRDFPLRPGMPLATLSARLGVEVNIVEAIMNDSSLVRYGPDVALPDFTAQPSEGQTAAWADAKAVLESGLDVPNDTELGVDPEMLAHLVRTGELVRISENFVYLPNQIESLKTAKSGLNEQFTVAQFRDATKLSRKYAVPILEWMDKEGLTVRHGETRSFR